MMKASIAWIALCMATASSLTGCGSMRYGESTRRCTDCATALYSDTGSGGNIYNVASSSEDAVGRVARRYCAEHGLGQPTIGSRTPSPLGSDFWGYDFSCGAPGTSQPQQTPQAQQPVGSDVEKFGATCTSIGFQKGTPEHGNCILRMMEMNRAQVTQGSGPSLQQQLRQQQREQAIQLIHQGLDGLSAQPPLECKSPVTMTMKLPCGDVVSCTKTGGQVSCDPARDEGSDRK
jgi:hypothetical protein